MGMNVTLGISGGHLSGGVLCPTTFQGFCKFKFMANTSFLRPGPPVLEVRIRVPILVLFVLSTLVGEPNLSSKKEMGEKGHQLLFGPSHWKPLMQSPHILRIKASQWAWLRGVLI